jgi:Flp pilus assembly protein TadB
VHRAFAVFDYAVAALCVVALAVGLLVGAGPGVWLLVPIAIFWVAFGTYWSRRSRRAPGRRGQG